MKKSRFSEHQIITILKSVEAGRTAKDVCREHGISSATFYAWKSKFGGMEASDIKRMRDLEHENALLVYSSLTAHSPIPISLPVSLRSGVILKRDFTSDSVPT